MVKQSEQQMGRSAHPQDTGQSCRTLQGIGIQTRWWLAPAELLVVAYR